MIFAHGTLLHSEACVVVMGNQWSRVNVYPCQAFFPSHRTEAILNIDKRLEARFLSKPAISLDTRHGPLPSLFSHPHASPR